MTGMSTDKGVGTNEEELANEGENRRGGREERRGEMDLLAAAGR